MLRDRAALQSPSTMSDRAALAVSMRPWTCVANSVAVERERTDHPSRRWRCLQASPPRLALTRPRAPPPQHPYIPCRCAPAAS
eukprot:scaffold53_cov362-Prasinococcus_capsulatus_cf.AAC.3